MTSAGEGARSEPSGGRNPGFPIDTVARAVLLGLAAPAGVDVGELCARPGAPARPCTREEVERRSGRAIA